MGKEIEVESDDPDAMEAKKLDPSGMRDTMNANDMCYEDQTLFYLKGLLKEWEAELDLRGEEQKFSAQGKLDYATFKQSMRNIRPFFKLLKKRKCPNDILYHMIPIVNNMKARNYIAATDHYVRLS